MMKSTIIFKSFGKVFAPKSRYESVLLIDLTGENWTKIFWLISDPQKEIFCAEDFERAEDDVKMRFEDF